MLKDGLGCGCSTELRCGWLTRPIRMLACPAGTCTTCGRGTSYSQPPTGELHRPHVREPLSVLLGCAFGVSAQPRRPGPVLVNTPESTVQVLVPATCRPVRTGKGRSEHSPHVHGAQRPCPQQTTYYRYYRHCNSCARPLPRLCPSPASGWITGHSYLAYGPLLCGCAIVLMGGVPTHPDGGRCWRMVERYKVGDLCRHPNGQMTVSLRCCYRRATAVALRLHALLPCPACQPPPASPGLPAFARARGSTPRPAHTHQDALKFLICLGPWPPVAGPPTLHSPHDAVLPRCCTLCNSHLYTGTGHVT